MHSVGKITGLLNIKSDATYKELLLFDEFNDLFENNTSLHGNVY